MGETSQMTILEVLLIGMLGMFFMTLIMILFFVIYQRRLLNQQRRHLEEEANYQQELVRASIESQEIERDRVSKDLHDEIGAMLNTIRLYTDQIDLVEGRENINALKEKTNGLLDETIQGVRRIAYDLHPGTLKNLGFIAALENLISKINDSDEISIHLQAGSIPRLDLKVELALYRVAQELISNTLKHAGADRVQIRVKHKDDHIHLDYHDNGRGFSSTDKVNRVGLGLKNIESRLKLYGGSLIFSKADKGTSIEATIKTNA